MTPKSPDTGAIAAVPGLLHRTERPQSLAIEPGTTFEQWLEIGRGFNRADDLLRWWLGDWFAYGETQPREWGHSRYDAALSVTGYDLQTLKNHATVARSVGLSRRRDELSFSHHIEVSTLEHEQQTYWLDVAVREKLSTRELRASIKAGRLTRVKDLQAQREDQRGIFTPQAIRALFDRTIRDIRTRLPGPVESWPRATREAWKNELKPIVEIYERL